MKTKLVLILLLVSSHLLFAQKKKDRLSPIYIGCDGKECHGSWGISFADTTKLVLRTCNHVAGCTNNKIGSWKETPTGFIIHPRGNVLGDFRGQLYRIKKDSYEILVHESIVNDTTKIIADIETQFKESEEYTMFFEDQPSEKHPGLKQKVFFNIIHLRFTSKYKLLVLKDPYQ